MPFPTIVRRIALAVKLYVCINVMLMSVENAWSVMTVHYQTKHTHATLLKPMTLYTPLHQCTPSYVPSPLLHSDTLLHATHIYTLSRHSMTWMPFYFTLHHSTPLYNSLPYNTLLSSMSQTAMLINNMVKTSAKPIAHAQVRHWLCQCWLSQAQAYKKAAAITLTSQKTSDSREKNLACKPQQHGQVVGTMDIQGDLSLCLHPFD